LRYVRSATVVSVSTARRTRRTSPVEFVSRSGLRRVTNVGSNHYVLAGSFSPDGTSIVFATDAEAAANPNAAQPFADVFTMRINGTNLKPATRTPNLDGWPTWGSLP
jgi:Tol biopolymer transport system component